MILPDKYIGVERSLLGQSAQLLRSGRADQTVSDLWASVTAGESEWTFARFTLALSLLHALDLVRLRGGILMWGHR